MYEVNSIIKRVFGFIDIDVLVAQLDLRSRNQYPFKTMSVVLSEHDACILGRALAERGVRSWYQSKDAIACIPGEINIIVSHTPIITFGWN